MMTLNEYLIKSREQMPAWLERCSPNDPFERERFFSSRVVYYPGAGLDFHAVEVFGLSGAAHAFVMVDASHSAKDYKDALTAPSRDVSNAAFLHEYSLFSFIGLRESDLAPRGVRYHIDESRIPSRPEGATPYACLALMERLKDLGDQGGSRRLAILFLGADGHASYDALFCQEGLEHAPFAALIQDHGWGGDYSSFASGGVMETIAIRTNVLPDYLLADHDSQPWSGYTRCDGVEASTGGQHGSKRILLERTGKSMGE
jgi:hypothetical protein